MIIKANITNEERGLWLNGMLRASQLWLRYTYSKALDNLLAELICIENRDIEILNSLGVELQEKL